MTDLIELAPASKDKVMSCIPGYLIAAVMTASLLFPGAARASVISIPVDDISIMIPLGDVAGNVGVAGARVTIGNRSVITDANGNYRVNGLVAGNYTLTVSR